MQRLGFTRSILRIALAGAMLSATGACFRDPIQPNPPGGDFGNIQNVVVIGDSIFALSGEIEDNLAAMIGQRLRSFTSGGARLSTGPNAVTVQYDMAVAQNPATNAVLMNGGGNDILIPALFGDMFQCRTGPLESLSARCQQLFADISVDLVNLFNEMASLGVADLVFLGYYYTARQVDDLEAAVDFGAMMLSTACARAVLNCVYLDTRPVIQDNDILFDGIHPNSSGSRKLADLILPSLQPLL